jgi:hypothetical protein
MVGENSSSYKIYQMLVFIRFCIFSLFILRYHFLPAYTLLEGQYERLPAKNNWHLVEISIKSPGKLQWKNKAGVKWTLTAQSGNGNVLEVGTDCPYYKNGYTLTTFNSTGIVGPGNEFYTYSGKVSFYHQ